MSVLPASEGVVAVVSHNGRLLVIRRSQFVVAPRQYCFPGGSTQAGEDEVAALHREIAEELGVRIKIVRRLWTSVTPWNVSLAWWHCEVLDHELRPNKNEVESVHWLTPDELSSLPELLESNGHFLDAWNRGEFELAID